MSMFFEFAIILLLVAFNAVLALSEAAIISVRRTRLRELAQHGQRRAAKALELAHNPQHLLSTVQLGITLIGIVAGAFSGVTLAQPLEEWLAVLPATRNYARSISLGLIVVSVTFVSIVLGELVPKRIAIAHAERIALALAPLLDALTRFLGPFIWILDVCSDAILAATGISRMRAVNITEEEINLIIEEGREAGVVDETEQDIVRRVLTLGDRSIGSFMTPRTDIVWIDKQDSAEEALAKVRASKHSYYPVCENTIDNVKGILRMKEIWEILAGPPTPWQSLIQPAEFVPNTLDVLDLLDHFQLAHSDIVLVLDEYGGLDGLVTIRDVTEVILGTLPAAEMAEEKPIVEREKGSWLVSGAVSLETFDEYFESTLAEEEERQYHTLAGLVMDKLGHLPEVAEVLDYDGFRFEVVDMDGNRVDKLLVVRTAAGRSAANQ